MEIAFGAMSLDIAGGDMILKLNRFGAYVLFSLKFTFSCIMNKTMQSATLKRGSRLNEPRCRYYNLISLKPSFGSPLDTFRYLKFVIKCEIPIDHQYMIQLHMDHMLVRKI